MFDAKALFKRVRELYEKEPAAFATAVVAVIGFLASQFHIILSPASVTQYVATGLVLLFGGATVRSKAIATASLVTPPHAYPEDAVDTAAPPPNDLKSAVRPWTTNLNRVQRMRARRLVVKAHWTFYKKAHNTAPYSQNPAVRFSGIRLRKRSYKGEYPPGSDCSSSGTWGFWDATRKWKLGDFVSGLGWKYGYTGTMQRFGRQVCKGAPGRRQRLLRGDQVFYGDQGGGIAEHTATYVGRRFGRKMVMSHGGTGVHYLPLDYRGDVNEVRRYIL